MGMDTHALSEPALATALEVFAAHGVEVRIQAGRRYTPTPAISHAILTWNRGRKADLADGVVVTPVAQPARRRRLQVQPARRRPRRHGHHEGGRVARQRDPARAGSAT